MLLKRISCQVGTGKKDIFSLGQAAWSQLNTIPGFVGQIGGWDTKDKHIAHLISLWKDTESYQYFMHNVHDEIYENSPQAPFIQNIEVETYAISIPLPDAYEETADYLAKSSCIRMERSQFNKLQRGDFTQMRIPWMLSAGKVGKVLFGESYKEESIFLTVTGWDSLEDEEWYQANKFPGSFKAEVNMDAEQTEVFHFVAEKDWFLRKTSTS
ncbi:protein of unknown function [Terribacillus aidingensis]|uniref:DUF4937 domain-containing protein n=1 Tax=Terribacillus aidingensis TaxID=586416 RepID=A0A285P2S7_9BACI|nr:YdbC family protein [Terribacillus aidingensis]SNZ15567.1 protein of unknown function [Terribacillus aidingensis]